MAAASIRIPKRGWLLLLCLLCSALRRDSLANLPRELRETGLEAAAAQNALIKTALLWMFGGKSQQGWLIYLPLIESLIGANRAQ